MQRLNRTENGWPICPWDRRRPRPKVKPVTCPEYERQMRELKRIGGELCRLEFKVRVCELNDRAEGII